jgi:hypothetical protein
MGFMTDLFWIAGAALSLGFVAYGAFLLLFLPKSDPQRAVVVLRPHLAS